MTRLGALAFALLLACQGTAWAHGQRQPADTSGIAIPLINHGEMAVLAPYRGEVMALAEQIRQPDAELSILVRYSGIQHANCLWGLVPGSITNEASPFNECSHADLAAVKAILLRLRTIPETEAAANDLVSRIDYEVAAKGAAFIGCQYSGEGFNSAEFIRPDWSAVPGDPQSLLSLSVALLGMPTLAFGLSRLSRSTGKRSRPAARGRDVTRTS